MPRRAHIFVPNARRILKPLGYKEYFIKKVEREYYLVAVFTRYEKGNASLIELMDSIECYFLKKSQTPSIKGIA